MMVWFVFTFPVWNIRPALVWRVVLVRLLFIISHLFATSHHPARAKCSISFVPPSAPPEFPTQTDHGLLPLTTAGAERNCGTWKVSNGHPKWKDKLKATTQLSPCTEGHPEWGYHEPKRPVVPSEGTYQKSNWAVVLNKGTFQKPNWTVILSEGMYHNWT